MSHTPGPWRAGIAGNHRVYGPDGTEHAGLIAQVFSTGLPNTSGVARANANLIAAAPDLLAALEAAYDALTDLLAALEAAYDALSDMAKRAPELGITLGDDDLKAIAQARAAIAKAKGEA